MSIKPKAEPEADHLQKALAELDKVGTRLDELKQTFNATVKEASAVSSAVTPPPPVYPTPVEAIPVQKLPSPGMYSIATPLKSERPIPPPVPGRPPIPRPTPRVAAAPPPPPKAVRPPPLPKMARKMSGRFYIQVDAANPDELRSVREKVSQVGRIVDSGVGTASNPGAAWLEIAVKDENAKEVVAKLRSNDLQEIVEKVVEVEPGEGRLQARQMELFRLQKAR